MDHDELVKRAVKWLRTQYSAKLPDGSHYYKSGCGVVVPELCSLALEQPDAIGWYGGDESILIECKTSRSDFLVDQKKTHRALTGGAGGYRFYFCPADLIKPEEVPEGWGLLYCHKSKVTIHKKPEINKDRSHQQEIRMMFSLLRRVEKRGLLKHCLAPKWGGDFKTGEPVQKEV